MSSLFLNIDKLTQTHNNSIRNKMQLYDYILKKYKY